MTEPTQRWPVPEPTAPPPPDPLPITLVSDHPPLRAPMSAPVVFPNYEIIGELGRGGMGVVYKARQRNLNRLVALKVILGGPLASTEDKARFHIEAEAAARLHHPNIVQVYDVGEYAGFSYMALELVEGQTLRQWQNGAPVAPELAARLVSAIARALQHAHEQGIVHRDIKPANVLLAPGAPLHPELGAPSSAALPTVVASTVGSPRGTHALAATPKVTDFGLAKPLEGGTDLTVTGAACGTPNYMAPEQVRGKALSPGVDVYGSGAVLYELLAGRPPFVGTDATEVMSSILRSDPPDVRKFAPAVPRDLAVIVGKCLEKDPARRYRAARDAADDLDRFLAGKPIAARPIGTAERAWRWVRRNPLPAAFLSVSTIGCAVTGGLAAALARSEADARAQRDRAETAREEADLQRKAAERARDGLRDALAATEAARGRADAAKKTADEAREDAKQKAARAEEKQQEADAARARAEDNLRVARGVIRVSVRELSRHPRFEDEEFRDARTTLIKQARSFRDTVAAHAPNAPEWLDDIADVSHWLGYLEFLNNNNAGAAVEYRAAAAAAGRWARLEPAKVEARTRQSFSLLNAGNALVNAGRLADAEGCYRDAVALIDAVVTEAPKTAAHRRQALDAHVQLVKLYQTLNRPADAERAARQELDRAGDLLRTCGETADHVLALATARLDLARALAGLKKWEGAEREYSAAVAALERARELAPVAVVPIVEYASAVAALANCQTLGGAPERADETFRAAVIRLETARAAAPGEYAPGLAVAHVWTQYADFLRDRQRDAEAERRYDQAVAMTTGLVRGAPGFRPGREALARALAGRALLYTRGARHRAAAAEWARLAVEDPDPRARPRHELYAMQSLLSAGDWKATAESADAQMKKEHPGWMWMDTARVWCLVLKQIEADPALEPADQRAAAEGAVAKAITCLEKAKSVGEFNNPERLRWYTATADFAPVRDKFDPNKK